MSVAPTVVLVHLHQVEVLPDDLHGDVVPAGVDQDPAVGEPRPVLDLGSIEEELALLTEVDELTEGLQPPEDAPDGGGPEGGPARLVGCVDLQLVWREILGRNHIELELEPTLFLHVHVGNPLTPSPGGHHYLQCVQGPAVPGHGGRDSPNPDFPLSPTQTHRSSFLGSI